MKQQLQQGNGNDSVGNEDGIVWSVMGEHFELPARYQISDYLGAGAYGVVASAIDSSKHLSKCSIAIKKCKKIFQSRALVKRALREIRLLRVLNHDNVVQCVSVLKPPTRSFSSIYVVFELMETDLASIIRSDQHLSDKHVRYFLVQLLRACAYLHDSHIIHRDLKPRNLLVNEDCTLKVADFGLARVTNNPNNGGVVLMTEYITTRWYRAPEILLATGSYGQMIDLWAVGCILAELLGRSPIFPGNNSAKQISLICDVLGVPDQTFISSLKKASSRQVINEIYPRSRPKDFREMYPKAHSQAISLVTKLLCWDHIDRLTAEEALQESYFERFTHSDVKPVPEATLNECFFFESMKVESTEFYRTEILKEIEHYIDYNEGDGHTTQPPATSPAEGEDEHQDDTLAKGRDDKSGTSAAKPRPSSAAAPPAATVMAAAADSGVPVGTEGEVLAAPGGSAKTGPTAAESSGERAKEEDILAALFSGATPFTGTATSNGGDDAAHGKNEPLPMPKESPSTEPEDGEEEKDHDDERESGSNGELIPVPIPPQREVITVTATRPQSILDPLVSCAGICGSPVDKYHKPGHSSADEVLLEMEGDRDRDRERERDRDRNRDRGGNEKDREIPLHQPQCVVV